MGKLLSKDIRKKILAEITPSDTEIQNQQRVIESLSSALRKVAADTGQKYSFIEAHGSTGMKQTQLRQAADIDLFVGLYPDDYLKILSMNVKERGEALDSLMDELIDRWFYPALADLEVSNLQKAFSQHPYLSLNVRGLDVDILGCFDLTIEQLAEHGPITAVDRTVHHSRYVAEYMTNEMREDARILKSFVRAAHAYGDKCAIGRMGFTGYSLELLIILCKEFNAAIRRLEKLNKQPLDPQNRTLEQLKEIPTFRDDHVFIIDPTDINRNVASSFNRRTHDWLRLRVKRLRKSIQQKEMKQVIQLLLESPIPDNPVPAGLRDHFLPYEFQSDKSVHYTILRDKLYRIARKVATKLELELTGEPRFGATLIEVYFENDVFSIGFVIEHPKISKFYIRKGPPANLTRAADRFRLTHLGVYEKDGHLWVKKEREWTRARNLADKLIGTEQVKGIKLAKKRGIVSRRLLNVLYRYVIPVEGLVDKVWQEFKDKTVENSA